MPFQMNIKYDQETPQTRSKTQQTCSFIGKYDQEIHLKHVETSSEDQEIQQSRNERNEPKQYFYRMQCVKINTLTWRGNAPLQSKTNL